MVAAHHHPTLAVVVVAAVAHHRHLHLVTAWAVVGVGVDHRHPLMAEAWAGPQTDWWALAVGAQTGWSVPPDPAFCLVAAAAEAQRDWLAWRAHCGRIRRQPRRIPPQFEPGRA